MNERSAAEAMLAEMYSRARAQWGHAVKAHWFYPDEACPGCQHPYQQTPLHTTIEQHLIAAYQRHLASLEA